MSAVPPGLSWSQGCLYLLDQRALPYTIRHLRCTVPAEVVSAIRALAVRGAPAIGLAGAYGVALAAERWPAGSAAFVEATAALAAARPTAANLATAVADVAAAATAAVMQGADGASAALRRAQALHEEDAARCAAIAGAGSDLMVPGAWVLTHCHTGAIATGGVGTALGAIALAHRRGRIAGVFACEARPLWQGARLTAWECGLQGIPCRLLADGAAGGLLASGAISSVLVGADRIAANGDVANKVGTYPLAVLAARHAVPFYVLAPTTSIDASLPSGSEIVIEQRPATEVLQPMAAPGALAYNPAFDVTPGALIPAIVTEHGIHRRPYRFAAGPLGKGDHRA